MSIIAQVRKKYGNLAAGTDKVDTSPSVSSVSGIPEDFKKFSVQVREAKAAQSALVLTFPAALRSGALVICARCEHWRPAEDALPDGWCSRFETEAWSSVPFNCLGYVEKSAKPSVL